MKSQTEIINEIENNGYVILDSYFDKTYCEDAIVEFEKIIQKNSANISINEREGTGGDKRLFGIENQSKRAKQFMEDVFLDSTIRKISKRKLKSHYFIGGKLTFNSNKIKNSGGVWHRDSDVSINKS